MVGYYLRLSVASVRRYPVTAVTVLIGIAVGIGVATTFVTLHHVLARDPIPESSDALHYVQLDSWDPKRPYPGVGASSLPSQVTYMDAVALARSDIPTRVTIDYATKPVIRPEGDGQRPFRTDTRAVRADFFDMFRAPFAAGGPWSRADDAAGNQVAIIGRDLSERVFGTVDSVGKSIVVEDRRFAIVGVLERWQPSLLMYDLTQGGYRETDELFVPFDVAVAMELPSTGNRDGWADTPDGEESQFVRGLRSENVWLQMWVQLDSDAQRDEYQQFVDAYVLEQRAHGRFQRPLDNRLTPLMQLMEDWEVVPDEAKTIRIVSLLFLALCVLSVIGLLLGNFLARSAEIGVRRALGASRRAIFGQLLTESVVLGALGGLVGLALSVGLLAWLQSRLPDTLPIELSLDLPMLALTCALALLSGVVAGIYPAWRVCTTPAAEHLKA